MLRIDADACLEAANISSGVFAPLTGFMTGPEYRSVCERMRLPGGEPWTIPITVEIPEDEVPRIRRAARVDLVDADDQRVALMQVEDVFRVEHPGDLIKVFKTDAGGHPGVRKERGRSAWRVGGRIERVREAPRQFPLYDLSPDETKRLFANRRWRTVVGFQTRNPPHRAHEHLQRIALETCDGLLIQPLIGWKKSGEFTPGAIIAAYERMIDAYYPTGRVQLATLSTPMRYAGPREAVFHALVRRNFGCTHFIVGRDHAGVGGYYGVYEAQELCRRFPDLGITVLTLGGPYYCRRCRMTVTENTCSCGAEFAVPISGTDIRACLREGRAPSLEMMRPEIGAALRVLHDRGELFCE